MDMVIREEPSVDVVALKLTQARDQPFQTREEHIKRLLKVGKGLVYSENQKEASVSGTQEGWGRQEAGVVRNSWITKGLVSQVKYVRVLRWE